MVFCYMKSLYIHLKMASFCFQVSGISCFQMSAFYWLVCNRKGKVDVEILAVSV